MTNTEPQEGQDSSSSFSDLTFLFSRSADGSGWISTLGMCFQGLPELQMAPIAGNHCRAARLLIGLVARKLARSGAEEQSDGSARLELSRADLAQRETYLLKVPEVQDPPQHVWVRLKMEPTPTASLEGNDESAEEDEVLLLSILPPEDFQGSRDEWLRWACRSLGQDVPEALPFASADEQIEASFVRARQAIPEFRSRFLAGLPGDQSLGVKFPLITRRGQKDYVWGVVLDWSAPSTLHLRLESEPRDCKGYAYGQLIDLPVDQVSDFVIGGMESGLVHPGFSQVVAEEFGLDIG